ncbi:MAG: F0F1 ATP synthase subunit epsilon [Polaribacter sp.]|jgi:F-type H+-transporting ATPase subunit epsilon
MFLEIVSPEAVLFSSQVDAIAVPGEDGEFQMLNNHAPIVANLKEGLVKIHIHSQQQINKEELNSLLVSLDTDDKILTLQINSGTLEFNDNKAIILAD